MGLDGPHAAMWCRGPGATCRRAGTYHPAPGTLQRLRLSKAMARKKAKSVSQKLDEPRQVSPDLQAGIDRFAKALRHLILIRIDPEAARLRAEDAP